MRSSIGRSPSTRSQKQAGRRNLLFLKILLLLGITFLPFQELAAFADGESISAWGGGGVLADAPPELVLEDMSLTISATSILCKKIFHNTSGKDLTHTVTFRVPPHPTCNHGHQSLWDEDVIEAKAYHHDRSESWTLDKTDMTKVPFLNFNVQVNGQPIEATHRVTALKDGVDVTPLLKKHKLPLSPDVAACRNLPFINFDLEECKKQEEKLRELHLVDSQGHPLWQNEVRFEWTQTFKAGEKAIVEYNYHPATGFISIHFDDERPPLESLAVGLLHTGCFLSKASLNEKTGLEYDITNWLLKKFSDDLQTPENNKGNYLYEVNYLLTEEGLGKKPINTFKLTVEHPEGGTAQANHLWPDMVFKRLSPTHVEATRSNFIPKTNVSVIIASPTIIKDVL